MKSYSIKIILDENKIILNNSKEINLDESRINELVSNTSASSNIRYVKGKFVEITYAGEKLPKGQIEGSRIEIGG